MLHLSCLYSWIENKGCKEETCVVGSLMMKQEKLFHGSANFLPLIKVENVSVLNISNLRVIVWQLIIPYISVPLNNEIYDHINKKISSLTSKADERWGDGE